MPPLTRWFIKTALVYLVLSLIAGVLTVAGPVIPPLQPAASLTTLYLQVLIIGWITQLIFGVAYWMFPIYTREVPRGRPFVGRLSYVLLNAGLILRVGVDVLLVLDAASSVRWVTGVAALLLFASAAAFVLNIWFRVKGH